MAPAEQDWWDTFAAVRKESNGIALAGARADIEMQQAEAVGGHEPALSLWCDIDGEHTKLVLRVSGKSGCDSGETVELTLEVLRIAQEAKVPPLTLVAHAQAIAPDSLSSIWRPRPPGGSNPPPHGPALTKLLSVHHLTDADGKIERGLDAGRDVVLIGDPGAGKTATGIIHTQRFADQGSGTIWLDLTDAADGPESVLLSLLSTPRRERYLVFIDGVQANPPAFEAVLACVHKLRTLFGLRVQILATAWPRLVKSWREPFKDFVVVPARAAEIVKQLISEAGVPAQQRADIRWLVRDDVHITLDAVAFWKQHKRVPSWPDLQSAHTAEVELPEHRRALYWFACLGLFGLDASAVLASAVLDPIAIQFLVDEGLIAYNDGRFSIPSHARAWLALRQALSEWDAATQWGAPDQLVWEHMQRSGERVIRATLSRLDLVGIATDKSLPFNASPRYLARSWELFEQLAMALARRCRLDATWNDNVGAAIFAASALVVTDDQQVWNTVAEFVRGRWVYDQPGVLPEPVGTPSAESADFDQILLAMREQDKDLLAAPPGEHQEAASIDKERFYRTWMLGTLLVFEATAMDSDTDRLDALKTTAEQQIDLEGYFYPRRVPWVTARIVLALCLAGETYHSSRTVRMACDWLRKSVTNDGPFVGYWHSGTGKWNTADETTAMCIAALSRADAPADNEIAAALAWLQTREAKWTAAGREIDLALVLEAMLLAGGHETVYYRALGLLKWVKEQLKDPQPHVDANDPEAELRNPFVASQLAAIVWATVTREYKALLRAALSKMEPDRAAPEQTSLPQALFAPRLDEWQPAIKQLNKRIVELLTSLDNVARNTPQGPGRKAREEIDLYRKLKGRVRELSAQLDDAPAHVFIELDEIGRKVCGLAWPQLEVPGSEGEPA